MGYFEELVWRNILRLFKAIIFIPLILIGWILLQVIILEPVGFFDVDVSEVPETPNSCVKVTETRYRYC